MQAETLEAITRSAAIPSMPLVATRCFEITQDPLCSYDKLVELLGTDPGIAAEVLRLANSAMFGVARQVDSLKQAIALLGLKRVRDLVLARYMVQTLSRVDVAPIDLAYFWRRSVTTAVVASRLAAASNSRRRDEAFLGGLLSDVGVIVLVQALPSKYKPIAAAYKPMGGDDWMQREFDLLGVSHAEISAMVLESWSLPSGLVDAVRRHHEPIESIPADAPGHETAPMISAAETIAGGLCEAQDPARTAARCVSALDRIKLGPAALVDALPHVQEDVEGLATILGLDVIPSRTYKLIADQISKNLLTPAGY